MRTLYAVPWYRCNLRCPHCHVSHREITENYDKFLEVLKSTDYDNVVLFGGEPTLDYNKFEEIIKTGKINSVSTNLTMLQPDFISSDFIPLIKEYNVAVATSWNFSRFTPLTYDIWRVNLRTLCDSYVDVVVMITMTDDLIECTPEFMVYVLGIIEGTGVKKFLFEPYIGDVEVNDKADDWLCAVHDAYPGLMQNLLEEKLVNWNCNCDDVYTLEPDGVIRKGCPDLIASGIQNFCMDCLNCNNSDICRPCMLQKTCSYPKKLARKLGIIK